MEAKKLLGSRLRELRRKHGYSQERVAELADMASNYLSRIEMGKENPTFDTFLKLARVYKVELWELLNYGHEVNRKDMESRLCNVAKNAKDEDLRLILKFINALTR
jgi:transcriptional regulator with XRE-family HTH domain